MPDQDPNAENRKRTRDVQCTDDSKQKKLHVQPFRPPEKCAPGEERLPEVYQAPAPAPVPEPPDQEYPNPIIIGNEELILSCSDIVGAGPIGDSVTIAQNQLTYSFFFQTIPDILPRQLTYIASLTPSTIEAIAAPSATVSFIRSVTKLDIPQAQFIKDELDALRAVAASEAANAAAIAIDCYWVNEEQTATCPGDALENPGPEGLSVNNPVTVPAGQFQSRDSQEDANDLAMEFALASLRCLYGNVEITRTCEDLGFDAIPTDTDPVGNAPSPRIGTVTIAAGLFFGGTQDEANDKAIAEALASLNCFYINTPFVRSCDDLGYDDQVVVDPVSIELGLTGNPVSVPAGWTYSTVSQSDAQAQAIALADALLDCYWVNNEVTVECPDEEIDIPGEDPQVVEPDPSSPVISATIPAGEVESRVSKEDANEQAELQALLQLDCLYCNSLIPPLCIPTDLEDYPIPIPRAWVDSDWSVDATLGVAAGTYCSDNAQESQQLAELIGQIPASIGPDGTGCVYENDEQQAECTNQDGLSPYAVPQPGNFVYIAAGVIRVRDDEVPVDWEPALPLSTRAKNYANYLAEQQAIDLTDCFYENDAEVYTCDPPANGPGAITSVAVPAGMFTSYVDKDEANALADSYGNSSLFCYYEDEQTRSCAAGTSQGSPGSLLTATGVGYGSTPAEATANAEALALAMLRCIYTNTQQTSSGSCPTGHVLVQNGVVPAGVMTGDTPASANSAAQTMAEALKVCVNPDDIGGGGGSPGNDGAQTNCDGECFGYYS